jgi:hypothetical protein
LLGIETLVGIAVVSKTNPSRFRAERGVYLF